MMLSFLNQLAQSLTNSDITERMEEINRARVEATKKAEIRARCRHCEKMAAIILAHGLHLPTPMSPDAAMTIAHGIMAVGTGMEKDGSFDA